MVTWYWSVAILFWQLSIDHIVNVQYKRCGFAKTRLRHPSLPFDSLPHPPPVQSVDACARSITWQPSEKRLTITQRRFDRNPIVLCILPMIPCANEIYYRFLVTSSFECVGEQSTSWRIVFEHWKRIKHLFPRILRFFTFIVSRKMILRLALLPVRVKS